MFPAKTFTHRRAGLSLSMKKGLVLLPGNSEAARNYRANPFHFRQDSSFLYFTGLSEPDLWLLMDLEGGTTTLFGEECTLDDQIWMGPKPSLAEKAASAGIEKSLPIADLAGLLSDASGKGCPIHFLPPYRGETIMKLAELLGRPISEIRAGASPDLIRTVVRYRSVKGPEEIEEIERALDISHHMYARLLSVIRPGVGERELAGLIEGIAFSRGNGTSFPTILSVRGEVLHNHDRDGTLTGGQLLLVDSGAETVAGYASDITRTIPVSPRFSPSQRVVYQAVLNAQEKAIGMIRPGIPFRDVHLGACRSLVQDLLTLGIMKGDADSAVESGAHALFFPHGIGHMLGLDVHDMESLGEDEVGYDEEFRRSDQFGLAYLRLARKLKKGFVVTVEPGLYFIPALIDKWKAENRHADFIRYEMLENFKGLGGIRIEDDVLVTESGGKVLGPPIPKTVHDLEQARLGG